MKPSICSLFCIFPLFFCGCDVTESSTLREISMPYVGEYQCQTLTIEGKDALSLFEKLTLTLTSDNQFTLFFCEKQGKKGEWKGEYQLKENEITFLSREGGKEYSRTVPYQNGNILLELPFFGKLLYAVFSM